MRIYVGKNRRPIAVEIWVCHEDTRWHVCPSRGARFLETIVLGVVYRRSPDGIWFRSPVGAGIRIKRASGPLMSRLRLRDSVLQIERLLAA